MFKQTLVVMVFITIAGSLACNAIPELNIEATVEALVDNRVAKIMEQATAEALLLWPVPMPPTATPTPMPVVTPFPGQPFVVENGATV